jgi:hypothetical protein
VGFTFTPLIRLHGMVLRYRKVCNFISYGTEIEEVMVGWTCNSNVRGKKYIILMGKWLRKQSLGWLMKQNDYINVIIGEYVVRVGGRWNLIRIISYPVISL